MTWKDIAVHYPEFVQWVVQTHGVKEGPVTQEDYERYRSEWEALTR